MDLLKSYLPPADKGYLPYYMFTVHTTRSPNLN